MGAALIQTFVRRGPSIAMLLAVVAAAFIALAVRSCRDDQVAATIYEDVWDLL